MAATTTSVRTRRLRRFTAWCLCLLAAAALLHAQKEQKEPKEKKPKKPKVVTLSPLAVPGTGQAGVATVAVTGSKFPSGTILPAAVTLALEPATPGLGPSSSAPATAVAVVKGSTRRIVFDIPASLTVGVPTAYRVTVSGTNTKGKPFVSSGAAALTVNPPASIASLTPAAVTVGQTIDVAIAGQFTSFVQGATQASFGPGMSVNGGAEGAFAAVTVTSPTAAVARVTAGASTAVGPRTVTVRTGAQQATLAGAFVVRPVPSSSPPEITVSLSPAPNANGWNNTPVTAHFTCTQDGFPLEGCPADRVVASEGADQTVTGSVTNPAGQTASVTSAPFSIDTTPPVLALSTPTTGTTVFTPAVTLTGVLSDPLSGVENAACNGTPATVTPGALTCTATFTPGANTVHATAVDRAGNQASSSLDFTYKVVPILTITQPANLSYTGISPTTVSGTVDDPSATVVVNSVTASVVGGAFSVALPLAEGPNLITATATSASGAAGTATLWVTLDTTPPRVTVTSPADQFVTTEPVVTVSGNVNDIVVGTVNPEQATVTVNGVVAQVANRLFLAEAVPLALGPNLIQVVGRDRVGNQGTTEITVTRLAPDARPRIRPLSGGGQNGTIRSPLPAPLAVQLTDAAGNAAPGKPVIFKVTQNDGQVASGGPAAPTVIATTDAEGRAQAQWTLGGRAGAGGNVVEAYSVGFDGTAIFTATGRQGPAGKIVVDTGNNQYGPIGQRLPRPLVAVVVDDGNNRLGGVPVTFTVSGGGGTLDGLESVTVVSDPDGRVAATLTLGTQEGEGNNVVSATFESNEGFPATFIASGRFPGDPAKTTITGVVLDNSNIPIPGVTVRAVDTEVLHANGNAANAVPPVQTDAQGQFRINAAPVGFTKLLVDGSTAAPAGTYPTLDYDVVTVAGQNMTVGQPIYLLPINGANSLCVTDSTGGGTLTIPEAPGFSLTFSPGQVTFPGGSKTGCVSVTVVHPDKVPMMPGFGQQPRFIVTIQPAGAVFNPPAPITLPNVDGLKPREVTEMYSFDHDIGSFVAIGTGTVSEDGQVVRSNAGVGVLKAGWHCGGNPQSLGTTADCGSCRICLPTPGHPSGECVLDPSLDQGCCTRARIYEQYRKSLSVDDSRQLFGDALRCVSDRICRTLAPSPSAFESPAWMLCVNKELFDRWAAKSSVCWASAELICGSSGGSSGSLVANLACFTAMAACHDFDDMVEALQTCGVGTDNDWNRVSNIVGACTPYPSLVAGVVELLSKARGSGTPLPTFSEEMIEGLLHQFIATCPTANPRSACNIFLNDALIAIYGVSDFAGMDANQIAAYLSSNPGVWTPLGPASSQDALDQAADYAGLGFAVVAARPDEPHGHVAIVLPGDTLYSGQWDLRVPNSASFFLDRPDAAYVGDRLSRAWTRQDRDTVALYRRNSRSIHIESQWIDGQLQQDRLK